MKLLSTLRYGSTHGMAAGTGNYGGDLRLFFTTLNPADTQPGPGPQPSVMWQGKGNGAHDKYMLPNGDVIELDLRVVASLPNELYIYGPMHVTSGAISFGQMPVGQSGPAFVPGQPVVAILMGRQRGQVGGKNFDVGFEIAVPWDGTMADCHGRWWTVWG